MELDVVFEEWLRSRVGDGDVTEGGYEVTADGMRRWRADISEFLVWLQANEPEMFGEFRFRYKEVDPEGWNAIVGFAAGFHDKPAGPPSESQLDSDVESLVETPVTTTTTPVSTTLPPTTTTTLPVSTTSVPPTTTTTPVSTTTVSSDPPATTVPSDSDGEPGRGGHRRPTSPRPPLPEVMPGRGGHRRPAPAPYLPHLPSAVIPLPETESLPPPVPLPQAPAQAPPDDAPEVVRGHRRPGRAYWDDDALIAGVMAVTMLFDLAGEPEPPVSKQGVGPDPRPSHRPSGGQNPSFWANRVQKARETKEQILAKQGMG